MSNSLSKTAKAVEKLAMASTAQNLIEISPDRITANPDNPRLVFREDEMRQLRDSINQVGIKVPLTVFKSGRQFTILDGERRWRCARKLNLAVVPVIVQPKPKPLENLLTMFNIHNVRVDWDVIAIAVKLGEIRKLLEADGESASFKDLAGLTGISQSMVRSCFELLELPKKYRDLLLAEAEKPRREQKITPDLFIEIQKSSRVVAKYIPEVFEDVTERKFLDAMFTKYSAGVVKNVVHFRDISKIARAERAGASRENTIPIVHDLVTDPSYTIEEAYQDSVKDAYEQRDLASRASALTDRLACFNRKAKMTTEVREALIILRDRLSEILGD